jgi:hypothetical protein
MADGVRLMFDDLARHGSAVRGERGDEPDQLERDARRALRRQPLRLLSGFTGSCPAVSQPCSALPNGRRCEPANQRLSTPRFDRRAAEYEANRFPSHKSLRLI